MFSNSQHPIVHHLASRGCWTTPSHSGSLLVWPASWCSRHDRIVCCHCCCCASGARFPSLAAWWWRTCGCTCMCRLLLLDGIQSWSLIIMPSDTSRWFSSKWSQCCFPCSSWAYITFSIPRILMLDTMWVIVEKAASPASSLLLVFQSRTWGCCCCYCSGRGRFRCVGVLHS